MSSLPILACLYPVFSIVIIRITEHDPKLKKWIISVIVLLAVPLAICWATNIYTTYQTLNVLLVSIVYLAIFLLLWLWVLIKKLWIKITGILVMIAVFVGGAVCALSAWVFDEKANTEVRIAGCFVYREYSLGFVTTEWDGVEVTLSKIYLGILEKQIFSKDYVDPSKRPYNPPATGDPHINHSPSFWASSFNPHFDSTKKQLILISEDKEPKSDTLKIDKEY